MFRTLLSVIAVLMLGVIAFLLYSNYVQDAPKLNADTLAKLYPATPPQVPATPTPAPAPLPQVPVVQTPPPAPAPAPVPTPEPAPVAGKHSHVVAAGDSLWTISRRYYGTPDHHRQIAAANNLKAKDRIRVGQVLLLPEIPGVKLNPEGNADAAAEVTSPTFEPMPPTLNIVQEKK